MFLNPWFRRGVVAGLPYLIVVVPFGLLFGITARTAGFNLIEIMGFSILVIAGASQFSALQLMNDNAPVLIVIATGLAVNIRMAMYSASLAPHLGGMPVWQRALAAYSLTDQSYAISALRFDTGAPMRLRDKVAYYFGAVLFTAVPWPVSTLVGATAGGFIPADVPLDLAIPITFLAMIAPLLRNPAHLAAAVVSVVLTLAFSFIPYNLGLLVAAVFAMMAGAAVEQLLARRRVRE
ncbi:AzlC family ABC transporter permease [Haematobacter genomosp. 1]|uniref:Branched-chain amino acid transporter AzlC n=1 Tax=Haematobacter genomosp. 1 TaxID=366618 RepID=A0A212ABQ9_9RHOB|nr:AzlC family ABC transporter permease [Haematobacter genomosp. 1]OWJ78155.1 branched-chain amino acid transporter AzlC [Haematobacter genomosp. 1]